MAVSEEKYYHETDKAAAVEEYLRHEEEAQINKSNL